MDIPKGWWREGNMYISRGLDARLIINVVELADGTSLEQFAQSVRDGLPRNRRSDRPLEITSFERTQVGGQDAYSIGYLQKSSWWACSHEDVVEMVVAASSLPGYSQGFRVGYAVCRSRIRDSAIQEYSELRMKTLDSFRVITRQSTYYKRFVFAHGITVKAAWEVNPAALVKAAEVMTGMMVDLRHDMRECLARSGVAVAITPRGPVLEDLPDFPGATGFAGMGATKNRLVAAVIEDDLLLYHPAGYITAHEFAHVIMELCFTEEDYREVEAHYDYALWSGAFPRGAYLMTNDREFFAEMSSAYFDMPLLHSELPENLSTRDALRTSLPQMFAFLDRVYGGSTSPPATPTPDDLSRVVSRDFKYAYSVEIPRDWRKRDGAWRVDDLLLSDELTVTAVDLADETTSSQFARSIRDELWRSGIGTTSYEHTQVGDRAGYRIAYQVREGDYCVSDVVEIIIAASSLPGSPQGFRAKYSFDVCDGINPALSDPDSAAKSRALRTRVLDSFRVFAE